LSKQLTINEEAMLFEKKCSAEISRAVNQLSTIIPNIQSNIAPVIDTSFKVQKNEGKQLNLKPMSSKSEGCWQTSICINAQTKQFHTKHDCTYTLICIPKQELEKSSKVPLKYDFLFQLTNENMINVALKPGVSFIFSGLFLTHRQNESRDDNTEDETFFNMASYGNKRLFHHLRKTYNKK
jgi:uncharacterized UPF0160 family protein